jgi:hypothetical protein
MTTSCECVYWRKSSSQMKKFHFTIFKLPHCPHVSCKCDHKLSGWIMDETTHVSCKCDYKLSGWIMDETTHVSCKCDYKLSGWIMDETTHVSCKCDYKLNEWCWMNKSRWCPPQMMANIVQ